MILIPCLCFFIFLLITRNKVASCFPVSLEQAVLCSATHTTHTVWCWQPLTRWLLFISSEPVHHGVLPAAETGTGQSGVSSAPLWDVPEFPRVRLSSSYPWQLHLAPCPWRMLTEEEGLKAVAPPVRHRVLLPFNMAQCHQRMAMVMDHCWSEGGQSTSSSLDFSLTPARVVITSGLHTYNVEQQLTVTLSIAAVLVNASGWKEALYTAQAAEPQVQHLDPRWT